MATLTRGPRCRKAGTEPKDLIINPVAIPIATRILVAACLLAGAAPSHAQGAPSATLVAAQSEIVFTTRQMGVPVEGRFGRFSAQVALDPKQPEASRVGLTIDATSARFGTAELDAEVGRPVWLAVAKFPQAVFESTAIKAAGAGRFSVTGRLTIKGTARNIAVPVQLAQAGGASVASGSFTIKRLDYQVGEGEWADFSLLADDIVVRFKLVLTGVPAL